MKRVLEIVLNAEGTIGGEQRHVLHILDGLDRDDFAPTVVTWDVPAFVAELERRAIPTVVVKGKRIIDLALLGQIADVISRGNFDLVHAHGHRAGMLGRLAALRAGAPAVVWTCHLAENKADRNPIVHWGYRQMMRYLDSKTDATIAVSPHLRGWLIAEGVDASRIEVIPNGIDCTVFRPMPRDSSRLASLGLADGVPVIVCVARLTEQKGVAMLLDAAGELSARKIPMHFLVVGAGPLEATLKARAIDSGAHVVFAGERTDIPEVLALADVAVVPSLWEGAFCFSVLEAMACARPLVCSDIPMFTDVVTSGVEAVTFAVGNAGSLSAAIERVLSNPEKAAEMGDAARVLVAEKYSVDSMRTSTFAVYDRVMGGDIS